MPGRATGVPNSMMAQKKNICDGQAVKCNGLCGLRRLLLIAMKHIVKILTFLVAIFALWIGLLQTSVFPQSCTWLLPVYLVVLLGCYGLLMVGIGLMQFPTCPEEATRLHQDIFEARKWLGQAGIDLGSE